MDLTSKILVTGHRGMVGSAVLRKLQAAGYTNVISSGDTDLRDQRGVYRLFDIHKPEYIFHVAGKVGGIEANNTRRGEFIYDNLMIAANVIHCAKDFQSKKLLYTGSSCIYPKGIAGSIRESDLLTGELEPTNEPYAIAKIAGIKLCQSYAEQYGCNFISVMPTNTYGRGDNYDLKNCHVVPAIIRKMWMAKKTGAESVELFGTGRPRRELMYVDDLADALVFLMNNYDSSEIVNIGTNSDMAISSIAELIKYCVQFKGEIRFNGNLDGTLKKTLDVSKINALGWSAKTDLTDGIYETLKHIDDSKW